MKSAFAVFYEIDVPEKLKNYSRDKFDSVKTARVINWVLKELCSISTTCKYAWETDSELKSAKRQWILGFMENGLSDIDLIKIGLRHYRALGSPFVPTVGQFMKWCIPTAQDLGILDLESSYREACKNSVLVDGEVKIWSDEVTRFAAQQSGKWNLCNLSLEKSRKLFSYYYDIGFERRIRGENFNFNPANVPLEKIPSRTDDIAKSALKNLKSILMP